MNKLYGPLGKVEHWLSQTFHGSVALNPSDYRNHVAIDLSGVSGTKVCASADGVCSATIGTGSARYFKLDINDCAFRILYVHSKSGYTKAIKVKKGQVIGEIIPYEYYVNGIKNRADHLHWGLQNKNGLTPHPLPMDYIDRTIIFKTRYPSITNLWFKNGKINWPIFRDLDYLTNLSNEAMEKELAYWKEYGKKYADLYVKYLGMYRDKRAQAKEIDAVRVALVGKVDKLETQLDGLMKNVEELQKDVELANEKYAKDRDLWNLNKQILDEKIIELQASLKNKKKDVLSELTPIELLQFAWEKIWDKLNKK